MKMDNLEMDPLHLQLFLDTFYEKVRKESLDKGKNLGIHYSYNEENNVYNVEKIDFKTCIISGKTLGKKDEVDMLTVHYINKGGLRCMMSIKFDNYKIFMDKVNRNIEKMTPHLLSKYNISNPSKK